MRVVVLGAGVIGVCTAYYLARDGHQVTIVDRQPGVALETSFANAGEVSPGYASPWAAPGVPSKAIGWLLMEHAPLILKFGADPAMLMWAVSVLRNCTSKRYALNKRRMVRLAEYSREQLATLRQATGMTYDEGSRGTLQLFRKSAQLDAAAKDIEVLRDLGMRFELLDAAACVTAEPGLAHTGAALAGGLRLPLDETGDCFKFSCALARLCEEVGVRFRFGVDVLALERQGDRVSEVRTSAGNLQGDAYVVALGSYSPALVHSLGLRLPVYPVKGYSITADIVDPARSPVSTLLDESYKIAITRLGDRIRVGGMAQLSGFDLKLEKRRRTTLAYSLESLFPGAGDVERASFWAGLRPMTPDGTPVVGATPLSNLWLNTGHGTLGWTMACGSGRLVADMLSGRETEIQSDDLALKRYA